MNRAKSRLRRIYPARRFIGARSQSEIFASLLPPFEVEQHFTGRSSDCTLGGDADFPQPMASPRDIGPPAHALPADPIGLWEKTRPSLRLMTGGIGVEPVSFYFVSHRAPATALFSETRLGASSNTEIRACQST